MNAFSDVSQKIPWRMPILDRWVQKKAVRQPLRGVTALFIQHQFGNQVPQTNALLNLGLQPERLFWLDVPYTSNAAVRDAIIKLGVPRRNLMCATDYGVLEPYAPYQRRRVEAFIHELLCDPPERLLVLDDGAYFIEAASCFKKRFPFAGVVEQTTRGLIKIESSASMRVYSDGVRLINVAQSSPKRTLEPPFIGVSVCRALERKLKGHFPRRHVARMLILGFGAIGSQVARFSKDYLGFERRRIHVCDPSLSRRLAARKQGYSLWDRGDPDTKFHLVIGCSGRSSFGVHDHVCLEADAVLASASSGSVELSREDFIELADCSKIDDMKVLRQEFNQENIHSDLRFRLVDKEATFLNGGFPVNFTGQVNCVPTRYMQPTATMMVAASVQAMSGTKHGIVRLDSRFCRWLEQEFRKELGHEEKKWLPRVLATAAAGGGRSRRKRARRY